MIPRFRLARPTSLAEAIAVFSEDPDESAYLAGGTELLQVMKMGLADFECLIDLKRIPDLRRIHIEADGSLTIGALATHREIGYSSVVASHSAELQAVGRGVGNVRVRAVGTIGGNLAFAEPHSDAATFLVACDASVELAAPNGRRSLSVEEFQVGALMTDRRPEEVLTAVVIPPRPAGTVIAFEKVAFFERPTAAVAVRTTVIDDHIADATVVVGALTDRPTRLSGAEQALIGLPVAMVGDAIKSIRSMPPDSIDTDTDHNGSADYKRSLLWELFARALARTMRGPMD